MPFGPAERAMPGAVIARALWKRIHRRRIESVYHRVRSEIDEDAFREIQRRYPTHPGDIGPNKYTDREMWLREAVVRALRLNLDRSPPLRVLDLGSGTGYFLLVCRTLGHDVVGIDLGDVPIFNEMIALFGLPRRIHRITPEQPIPEDMGNFDLITAFMITFNEVESEREWGVEKWETFLANTLPRLTTGGRLCMTFNYSHRRGMFYDRDTARLFDNLKGFRTARSGNEVLIRRVG